LLKCGHSPPEVFWFRLKNVYVHLIYGINGFRNKLGYYWLSILKRTIFDRKKSLSNTITKICSIYIAKCKYEKKSLNLQK
jgi:hypothetical protein